MLRKKIKCLFFTIIIVLVVVGFLLWLIEKYIPMDATIKRIIEIVIIIAVVFWLLNIFGILSAVTAIRVALPMFLL
jgi:hypothetical protein